MGDPEERHEELGICEHEGCKQTARYGEPRDGFARACSSHRSSNEARVDLTAEAVFALADSCSRNGSRACLHVSAALHLYGLRRADWAGNGKGGRGGGRSGGRSDNSAPTERPMLSVMRLLNRCARARALPVEALQLQPAFTYLMLANSPEGIGANAWNALLSCCSGAADADAALQVYTKGRTKGLQPDGMTFTSLCKALCLSDRHAEAIALAREAQREGFDALSNEYVVTTLLTGVARSTGLARRRAVRYSEEYGVPAPQLEADGEQAATELYEEALRAGLQPTRDVLNALSKVHAECGRMGAALALFHEGAGLRSTPTTQREHLRKQQRRGRRGRPTEDMEVGGAVNGAVGGAAGGNGGEGSSAAGSPDPLDSLGRGADYDPRDGDRVLAEDKAVATVLAACVAAQDPERAFEVFRNLTDEGYAPTTPDPFAHLIAAAAMHGGQGVREAAEIYRRALGSGIRPNLKMINELLAAHARVGEVEPALEAWKLARAQWQVQPSQATLCSLLRACIVSRTLEPARQVVRLAEDDVVQFGDLASSLLLEAHLAAISPDPEQGRQQMRSALDVYLNGSLRGLRWEPGLLRKILGKTLMLGVFDEALEVHAKLQEAGVAISPETQDALFEAAHRSGDIDEEAAALWREGKRDGPHHRS